jgi:hypothetical protein
MRSCTNWNGVTPLLNKNLEAEAAEAQKVAAATTNRYPSQLNLRADDGFTVFSAWRRAAALLFGWVRGKRARCDFKRKRTIDQALTSDDGNRIFRSIRI